MKEKANVMSAVPRPAKKVKGTVLFTVVCVMMVLIVFLMGTLALAATANKRAQTDYQQEQAEYTARAILDATMQTIRNDTTTTGIRNAIATMGATDLTIKVTGKEGGNTIVDRDVIVHKLGQQRQVYNTSTQTWDTLELYELSVTVDSQTTSASATYHAVMGANTKTVVTNTGTNPNGNGAGGAFVSLGDTGGNELATKGYTTGGTFLGIGVANYSYTMSTNGKNVIDAPFYVNGDLTVPSYFTMHFTNPGDYMVVMGDLTLNNDDSLHTDFSGFKYKDDDPTKLGYSETPYIYIDGEFNTGNNNHNKYVGDSEHPVNVYAGSLTNPNNGYLIYGDLYTMGPDKTTINTSGKDMLLYKWTKGNVTRSEGFATQYGNWYANADVEIQGGNGLTVQGDLQVNGNLTAEKLYVTGDVVVNGTLNITGEMKCKNLIASNIIGNNIKPTGTIKAVTSADTINGITVQKVDATTLAPSGTSTIKTWYEDASIDDGNMWTSNHKGKIMVTYTKKVSIDGGTPSETKVINDTIVNEEEVTDAATLASFTSFTDYAKDKYPEVKALLDDMVTYTSEATAKEESVAAGYNWSKTTYFPRDVYPANYTREKINDNILEDPMAVDYENTYVCSVDSMDDTLFKDGKYQVPIYYTTAATSASYVSDHSYPINNDVTAATNAGLLKDGYYLVTDNCVITGSLEKNIYVDSTGKEITLFLDNVGMGGNNGNSIIVDDTKKVTIVIVGTVNLGTSGQGTAIVTADYLDLILGTGWSRTANLKTLASKMTQAIEIPQVQPLDTTTNTYPKTYPNVEICSDDNATIHVHNGGFITGLIRAPKLVYECDQATAANQSLNYKLPNDKIVKYGKDYSITGEGNDAIGLIGQLIAKNIKIDSNGSWGMLYVTNGDTSGSGGGSGSGSGSGSTYTPGSSSTTVSYVNTFTIIDYSLT